MCVCVCGTQTHVELVASQSQVKQLESELKQSSSETRQRYTQLTSVAESRDEAHREIERLMAELQQCRHSNARQVHMHTHLHSCYLVDVQKESALIFGDIQISFSLPVMHSALTLLVGQQEGHLEQGNVMSMWSLR